MTVASGGLPVRRRSRRAFFVSVALVFAASTGATFAFLRLPGVELMPHGMCYLWNSGLLWSNVIADTLIGLSYAAITISLLVFLAKNKWAAPFHWIVAAFAVFILACGASHIMDVVTLWKPVYWLSTNIKFITAAASALTALAVPVVLPRVSATIRAARQAERYREEVNRTNIELARRTIERSDELARANTVLEARIAERTIEVNDLNAALAAQLGELQRAYGALESDAAERKAVAVRLDHLAHHDPVTALPNRVRLMERLGEAIAVASRTKTSVLVFYLDLDRFKSINDTFGHAAGDRVLAEIGRRIGGCLRAGDTASRVGGDEFVLVIATADSAVDAPQLAMRLLDAVAQPFGIDHINLALGVSIGISIYPGDGADPERLIADADMAMYRAKQSGRNCFALYSPERDLREVAATTPFRTAARD